MATPLTLLRMPRSVLSVLGAFSGKEEVKKGATKLPGKRNLPFSPTPPLNLEPGLSHLIRVISFLPDNESTVWAGPVGSASAPNSIRDIRRGWGRNGRAMSFLLSLAITSSIPRCLSPDAERHSGIVCFTGLVFGVLFIASGWGCSRR
ncbi:hypothetical protein TNCV_3737351 [Trichonephila clavipes]|nr:hypothetical protein TNCV_3737351 [Trichonephila clavipes]